MGDNLKKYFFFGEKYFLTEHSQLQYHNLPVILPSKM
jgi:hypothetical protein